MGAMEKCLFSNPFLAVIDRDGYTFVHEVRCDGHIVSLLPFRRTRRGREYLARRETCPAHAALNEQPELCSITGGVEPTHTPTETAQIELFEEAGYKVHADELMVLGAVKPSKAMDTVAHLYAVDVTHKVAEPAPGDGTRWEVGASVEWVNEQAALEIGDPLFLAAIAHLRRFRLSRPRN